MSYYGGAVAMGHECCEPSPEEKAKREKEEKKWRADADLRTVIQAQEIRNDPERFAEVKKLHKDLTDSLKIIEGQSAS